MPSAFALLKPLLGTLAGIVEFYAAFVCLLAILKFPDHVIFLHRVRLTWSQDVIPEH
jgi:abhydrolase domain-containing protein 12